MWCEAWQWLVMRSLNCRPVQMRNLVGGALPGWDQLKLINQINVRLPFAIGFHEFNVKNTRNKRNCN